MTDSTRRFSSRVENYVRYRPGYPPEVIELLTARCGLTPDSLVADIGSGTGLLARLFLAHGCRVLGVEPNGEMRAAGERLLSGFPNFTSVEGTAEATTLPAQSVDFVTAGQAFHWFDRALARTEFARLLRPGGWVVLVWNDRRSATTPFLAAYEQLLERYATDYAQVNHKRIDEATIGTFFAPGAWSVQVFENRQQFDFAGLQGRLLSSSYTPEPGHPGHQPMIDALRTLFDTHQHGGQVAFEYDTTVYYGRLRQT
ncbi:MAG: class I SAM-dependent methyltransferase [Roseiflexaceae bacterium]